MNQTPDQSSDEQLQRLVRPSGLLAALDMTVIEATRERVVVQMPVSERHLQPRGDLHGGASVALAETAASIAGSLNAPEGMTVFGQEINANHIRPKRDGVLTATATPLHVGRMSQVWDVKIRDENDKLVCVSRCTIAAVPLEPHVR
ncbi:MAG TPA: hotdog fold thioesterase [Thermomicrobiaceae bacterium]|nr:hotdog fold thioesterase [Thermomicrobiaceae bacterium]